MDSRIRRWLEEHADRGQCTDCNDGQIDVFPGVTNDAGFTPIDPDIPAYHAPEPDVLGLLNRIAVATEANLSSDIPIVVTRVITLGAGPGEQSIMLPVNFRHIFIPDVPRPIRVFSGLGKAFYIASARPGQTIKATIPQQSNGITFEWDEGAINDQIVVILSGDEYDVSVMGSEQSNTVIAQPFANVVVPANGTVFSNVTGNTILDIRGKRRGFVYCSGNGLNAYNLIPYVSIFPTGPFGNVMASGANYGSGASVQATSVTQAKSVIFDCSGMSYLVVGITNLDTVNPQTFSVWMGAV